MTRQRFYNTRTEKPLPHEGFYGAEWGTYHVTPAGGIWLIQSDDRDDLPVEVVELPEGLERLDPVICQGMLTESDCDGDV